MSETITVRGYVATEVRLALTPTGLPIAGFRMCTTERRYDREAGAWVDGHTNWYSVSMFRQLATNASASLKKGDRVVVFGRLKVRPWATEDGRTGTSVEIDAESVGHDLMWGTAAYRRSSAEKIENTEKTQEPDDGADDAVPEGVDPATGQILAPDNLGAAGGSDEGSDSEGGEGDLTGGGGRSATKAGAAR
ncbi:MAG: single-strand binding protein [uncultured Arthrobacter sp.]|uniref:Single-stranded DNA-binding protein n=1 Tax=uncultured Arthrobacter sp. TaxID=114050 RepID=A0A6J4IA53_9MICC|nr:single-stranded DNA-binding protein [uncultured Arthrobacter sp.]CAA9246841.1 MAG: single-strand binding protein [uncultured Arthrobacter sp.]